MQSTILMEYKYFAFISYSSHDTKWGKRLQRKLEHYRMPATLCSKHKWSSKTPLRPVFFAATDIQPGDLSEEIKHRLEASRFLIVICSPNSAQSEWVGKEIRYFHSLGRPQNIHFFIVRGIPHSTQPDLECFNPVIKELNFPEILGANIQERVFHLPWLNRERAFIQLITKLLEIDFDVLWHRHRKLIAVQSAILAVLTAIISGVIFLASTMHKPVDVIVHLKEATPINMDLPPMSDARVSLILDNERKDISIGPGHDVAIFNNIPCDMLGKHARILFSCENYISVDSLVTLNGNVTLNVSRDINAYGHVHFTLYNRQIKPLANVKISVDGIESKSGSKGEIDLTIPIEKQRTVYHLASREIVLIDTLKDAKCGACDAIIAY